MWVTRRWHWESVSYDASAAADDGSMTRRGVNFVTLGIPDPDASRPIRRIWPQLCRSHASLAASSPLHGGGGGMFHFRCGHDCRAPTSRCETTGDQNYIKIIRGSGIIGGAESFEGPHDNGRRLTLLALPVFGFDFQAAYLEGSGSLPALSHSLLTSKPGGTPAGMLDKQHSKLTGDYQTHGPSSCLDIRGWRTRLRPPENSCSNFIGAVPLSPWAFSASGSLWLVQCSYWHRVPRINRAGEPTGCNPGPQNCLGAPSGPLAGLA